MMGQLLNRIAFLVAGACAVLLPGCRVEPGSQVEGDAPTAVANGERIEFANGALTIQGTEFHFPLLVATLVETIGPPDRVSPLPVNHLSTWDELGIVVYEKQPGDPVNSIDISLMLETFDFSPKNPFEGTVVYNNVTLSRNSTEQDLIDAGLVQDKLLPFLYMASDGEFEIIAEFENGLSSFSINR